MRIAPALIAALMLGACGQRADLVPPPGQSLPPAPYGAAVQPDAAQLLKLDSQSAPERSVELRSESEEREDDPFDLPPEG